ncbi:hypothetical protein BJV77DRAFT_331160 [Russula vinacea]|nr:hypothetical protein BJV77DRAFT_331160 [Russula vinacea]
MDVRVSQLRGVGQTGSAVAALIVLRPFWRQPNRHDVTGECFAFFSRGTGSAAEELTPMVSRRSSFLDMRDNHRKTASLTWARLLRIRSKQYLALADTYLFAFEISSLADSLLFLHALVYIASFTLWYATHTYRSYFTPRSFYPRVRQVVMHVIAPVVSSLSSFTEFLDELRYFPRRACGQVSCLWPCPLGTESRGTLCCR